MSKEPSISLGMKAKKDGDAFLLSLISLFKAFVKCCVCFFVFLKSLFDYIVLEAMPGFQKSIRDNVDSSGKPIKNGWKNPYAEDD